MAKSKTRFLIAVLVLLASAVVTVTLRPPKRDRWTVRIATATPGGTYYPVGVQFAHILEELPGGAITDAFAWQTSGSQQNVTLLCNPKRTNHAEHEDRPATDEDWSDLGFVAATALALASQDQRDEIRALAALYADVIQVVVRADSEVRALADLRNKTIYIGRDGSGTKQIAEVILETAGLVEGDYERRGTARSYREASEMLQRGELDAAVFCSGTPTNAVREVFERADVRMLNLEITPDEIEAMRPEFANAFTAVDVPANFYRGQAESVSTLAVQVIMACRKDLDNGLASLILDALFDNVEGLLLSHQRVPKYIRFQKASDPKRLGAVKLHPGAIEFWEGEKEKLLIATGSLAGEYYDKGKVVKTLLEQNGIPARAIHTDGSVENASLLQDPERPVLAFMQYDTALATHLGRPDAVFKQKVQIRDTNGSPVRVRGMRGIAAFHEEAVHILVRRDKLSDSSNSLAKALMGWRVCLGPERSGTRILAEAILLHHDIPSDSIERTSLSIPQMVSQLHGGDIDAGFFVDEVPSEALETILADDQIKLLSINRTKMANMLGPALWASRIDPGTYPCQLEDEPAIETISTRTVLVTTESLPFDVGKITRILFEKAAYLRMDEDADAMAWDSFSIPLHPAAIGYYREAGHLPSPESFDWLTATWRVLAILVILVGAYQGLLKLRRDKVSNEISRRVFAVSVATTEPASVRKLVEIRSEIDRRVKNRWWRLDEVDKSRWRTLNNLIESRIREAKENLTRALLTEFRTIRGQNGQGDGRRGEEFCALEERIWKHLENGELDEPQHSLLLKVRREGPTSS
jgi:TRAP transporter TAXI family solute receptor